MFKLVNASTLAPVCDPTFTAAPEYLSVLQPVSFQACSDGPIFDCPTSTILNPPPCYFVLTGLTSAEVYTVEVSAPGYQTMTVYQVVTGAEGCFPYIPPTEETIGLIPVSVDAAAAGP